MKPLTEIVFLSWHIKEVPCAVYKSNLNAHVNKLIKRKMTLFGGFSKVDYFNHVQENFQSWCWLL